MTINAGVWIDHHKAVVIILTDKGEDVLQILPDAGASSQVAGEAGVTNSYTPNDFVAEDKLERKAMNHLHKYYDEVIACLRDADAILVLGPGEAKGEFAKRIAGTPLKGHVAEVKTTDKLTDGQITEHVRQYFQQP